MKSIPCFKPNVHNEMIPTTINVPEMMNAILLPLRKSKFNLVKALFVILLPTVSFLSLSSILVMMIRVMKIAVNNDVRIPIIRVVAKPLTGPTPK